MKKPEEVTTNIQKPKREDENNEEDDQKDDQNVDQKDETAVE